MRAFEVLGEDQTDWASVDLCSHILNVIFEELAHADNLEITPAEVGTDVEGLFVEEQSLIDELSLMVIFKELDAFSREITVLTQVLELFGLLMN